MTVFQRRLNLANLFFYTKMSITVFHEWLRRCNNWGDQRACGRVRVTRRFFHPLRRLWLAIWIFDSILTSILFLWYFLSRHKHGCCWGLGENCIATLSSETLVASRQILFRCLLFNSIKIGYKVAGSKILLAMTCLLPVPDTSQSAVWRSFLILNVR